MYKTRERERKPQDDKITHTQTQKRRWYVYVATESAIAQIANDKNENNNNKKPRDKRQKWSKYWDKINYRYQKRNDITERKKNNWNWSEIKRKRSIKYMKKKIINWKIRYYY